MPNDVERLAELIAGHDLDAARALAAALESTNADAAALARRAVDAVPSDPARAQLQIAALYMLAGNRELAISSADKALTGDPSHAIQTSVATIYLGAERYEEARQQLQAVIAADPTNRDAHLSLAAAAFRLGDIGAAVSAYARAFDLDPTDMTPIRNLSEMLAQVGKWLGALSALSMVRRGEPPPDVAIALDLATIQVTQLATNMFPAAQTDPDSDHVVRDLVSKVQKRGPRSQLAAAKALFDVGRIAEATALAQHVATLPTLVAGERADLHYLEGLLAEYERKREAAVDHYAQVIALDPTRTDAATNALSLLVAHGTPGSLMQIEPLLAQLDPAARAASAALAFNEARYIHKAARPPADARVCLERVLELTGGTGNLADLARQALEELERT